MPYQFFVFVLIVQTLLWLAHLWFYKTAVRFFALTNPSALFALKLSLAVLSVSFLAGSLWAARHYNVFSRVVYTLGAGWMGFLYFFLWAALLLWLIYAASAVFALHLPMKPIAAVVTAAAVILAVGSLINAASPRVIRVEVSLPNLPEMWRGRTAVWTSDVHLGQVRGRGFAEKVASLVKSERPDIVFIGGDLYDGVAVDEVAVVAPFKNLGAPLGTYFVTGNHEEFGDSSKYLSAVSDAGMFVLDNRKVEIDGMQLVGAGYVESRGGERLKALLEKIGIRRDAPSMLLKHTPFDLEVSEQAGISLQISGHTHRAQVWPFSYITKSLYKGYDYGFKPLGGMQVYTSSGTGTWGPPVRFGTRPEIVVFTFK